MKTLRGFIINTLFFGRGKDMKHHSMRALALVLSVLLAIGCVPFTASAEEPALPASDLSNLAYILNNGNDTDLRIVYLGGSVTAGAGATKANEGSWRALVGKWFTETVGEGSVYGKTVTNIDAGIGATGSFFGAYRFYRDGHCDEGAPDVLFIEYSINDGYDSINGTDAAIYYESILRQAYAVNPKIQIIPVFTTDVSFANAYLKNGTEGGACFEAHRRLAEHYNLPQLNVGRALVDVMAEESGQTSFTANDAIWKKYITDSCHPNDAGYVIYAKTITDYLEKQLFSNEVVRTGTYTDIVLPETTYSDASKLILNGRYISFKDAGFTQKDLNGFTLNARSGESVKASSNGTITSNNRNASFAYTFKGRGTGFYNFGYPASGSLKWTITAVDDESITYSGKTSLIKNYSTGLPIPAAIINGLADREWRAEYVLDQNAGGVRADLRYIYVDGDPSTVHPATAPDTKVIYLPTVVKASDLSSGCSLDGAGTFDAAADFHGLSARALTPKTSSTGTIGLNWWGCVDYSISFPGTKYIAVTYYYEDTAESAENQVAFRICQVNNVGNDALNWITGGGEDADYLYTQRSAPVVTNKWVTQYFDYTETAAWLAETYPGMILKQVYFYPYGTEAKGNTVPAGQVAYLNNISFHQEMPILYNTSGERTLQNDGSAIAYVSETGSVTVGGKTYEAYEAIADAIKALSPVGGTIYFTGTQVFSDTSEARGKITLIGLDSTAYLTNQKLEIYGGDTEFDNLTMAGAGWESWTRTNGNVLTFGKNFKSEKTIYYGQSNNGKANKIDFHNGSFGEGGAAAEYGRTHTVTGDTIYNYYGGSFNHIRVISRNGKGTADGGIQTVNGDIYLNIYGGSFVSVFPATTTAVLNGSAFINVSGGKFKGDFSYGSAQDFVTSDTRRMRVNGDYVLLFNNAEIKAAGGSLAGRSIGITQNQPLILSGKKIIISNNHELASDTGLNLSGNLADVVLTVSGGKAELVRGENGICTSYTLTPDKEGDAPYANGVKLLPDEGGFYTLNAGTTEIVFRADDSIDVIYADGSGNTVETIGSANNSITLPVNPFTKSGYTFAGWRTEGDDTVYAPGDTYLLGETAVTFTARWLENSEVPVLYVKQSAERSGLGLTADAPVKTIKEAINIAGADRDFTIMFLDDYNESQASDYAVTGANHTGTITFSSAENGSLGWVAQFCTKGPAIFENINFKIRANNNFIVNDQNPVVFGKNVKILPYSGTTTHRPKLHMGRQNGNTSFQNFRMDSGSVNIAYIGPFYNSQGTTRTCDGAKVTVNGGTLDSLILGPDSYGSVTGGVRFTGTVTVLYSGGKINSITKGPRAVSYADTQFIANNGLTFPALPSETDNGKRYIINSAVGGTVTDTDTVGTFKIVSQSGALFIDGERTAITDNDLYTLTPGTHTVTYGSTVVITEDGNGSYIDEAAGSITVGKDSIAAFTESSILSRDGALFIGWFKGEEAVKNGDALRKGDVLTAHFLPIRTESQFNVLGAQVRLTGEEGLRFVHEFTMDLYNALRSSGVAFMQSTVSSDANIGTGFVILPESYLSEGEALTMETASAHTVPAKNIFAADENAFRYTVCVTGIVSENYTRRYAVVPYITYNTANGVSYTFYGEQYATSIAAVAKAALADESATFTDAQIERLNALAKDA